MYVHVVYSYYSYSILTFILSRFSKANLTFFGFVPTGSAQLLLVAPHAVASRLDLGFMVGTAS